MNQQPARPRPVSPYTVVCCFSFHEDGARRCLVGGCDAVVTGDTPSATAIAALTPGPCRR